MSADDSNTDFSLGLSAEERQRLKAFKASNGRFGERVDRETCKRLRRLVDEEGLGYHRAGSRVGVSYETARNHARGTCDCGHEGA